jgi:hypothetical protein
MSIPITGNTASVAAYVQDDEDGGNQCDVGNQKISNTQVYVGLNTPASSFTDCWLGYMEFDVSGIPDGVTIVDINLDLYTWNGASTTGYDVVPLGTTRASDSASALFTTITNESTEFIDDSTEGTANAVWNLQLGSNANSDLESHLSLDYWGIGFRPDSYTMGNTESIVFDSTSGSNQVPTLNITYEAPPDNTKLLGLNDVTLNVGTDSASIINVVTTGGDHIDDDFASSPNGWTQVGSSLTITGGKATMSGGTGSTDNALRKALGSTLGDKFTIDLDLSGLSASFSTTYWKTFGLCDSSTSFSSIPSTDDCFWALSRNTGGTEFQWTDDGTTGYSGNTGLGWDFSEPNGFNRLSFDGTSVTYSTYPDATRTGTPSNTGTFTIPASLGGFTHFTIGGYDGNEPSSRNVSWTIDNLLVTDLVQTTQNVLSVTGLTDNTSTPQHYTFTRSANDWEIYQNGVSKGTATDSTSLGAGGVVQLSDTNDFSTDNMVDSDSSRIGISNGVF